ncbi:MAG: hypothetical protein KC443_04740 [Anaerolineales bacterium]|nr:hypothetical protein [Anaerolineales bacterium]
MVDEIRVQRALERQIDTYRQRYHAPNPATIRKWRRQAVRECEQKNQLSLPLVFDTAVSSPKTSPQ